MDSQNFYFQITNLQNEYSTPSQRLEKKIHLLNEFKNFIKKNVIKSSYDASNFFKALKYSYSEQISTTSKNRIIAQTLTLSCIGHLVKRISCQTDTTNPFMAVETYTFVLPFLVTCLGEIDNESISVSHKTTFGAYFDKSISVLKGSILDFWLAVPIKIESWLRDYLMENSLNNSIIRNVYSINECLIILLDLIKSYNPNLNLSIYYVPLIKLCQFFSAAINKNDNSIDFKVYENSSKLIRISLKSNHSNKQTLIEIADNLDFDNNILNNILKLENDATPNTLSSSQPNIINGVSTSYDSNNKNSINLRSAAYEPLKMNISYNQEEISKEMNKILLSAPTYKLENLKPINFSSLGDVFSQITNFPKDFEGRETEFNWSKREKTITKLRSIIRASLFINNNNNQKEFLNYLKCSNLFEGINKAINSLRTTLSANGCKLAKEIFQIFEIQNFEHSIIELIFKNIIKLTAATKKINSSNANVVICTILSELKSFNFRIFNMIYDYSSDKNLSPRIFVGNWISIIILNHPSDLNKIVSENLYLNNSSQESNAIRIVEKIIAHGLSDASPLVREQLRKTFWLLYRFYPNEADGLYKTLSSSALKLLNKVRPSNIPPIENNGLQRSSNRCISVGDQFRYRQSTNQKASALDPSANKRPLYKSRSVSEMTGKSLMSTSRNEGYDRMHTVSNSSSLPFSNNTASAIKEERHMKNIKEPEPMAFNIGKPMRIKKNITPVVSHSKDLNLSEINRTRDLSASAKSLKDRTGSSLDHRKDLSTIISDSKSDISNISVSNLETSIDGKKLASTNNIITEENQTDSTDDTDNEINNTLANKLHIHDSRDYDKFKDNSNENIMHFPANKSNQDVNFGLYDQNIEDSLSIEGITKLFYETGVEQHELAVQNLITLLNSDYKFFMNDYSLLNSGLHELASKNPVSLFPIINIDLVPKFVDIIQVGDFLRIFILYQKSEISQTGQINQILNKMIYLLTFDDLINNYISLIDFLLSNNQASNSATCLENLKYLILDNRVVKFSSNKQIIIDKILLNLILIWQKQETIPESSFILDLIQECISIIEKNYNQCFKFFLTDTFDKSDPIGKSKNILVHKNREEFGKLIGKQWRVKTVEKRSNVSTSSDISTNSSMKINIKCGAHPAIDTNKSSKDNLTPTVTPINLLSNIKQELDVSMKVFDNSKDHQDSNSFSDKNELFKDKVLIKSEMETPVLQKEINITDSIPAPLLKTLPSDRKMDIDEEMNVLDFNDDELKLSPIKRTDWGNSLNNQSDIIKEDVSMEGNVLQNKPDFEKLDDVFEIENQNLDKENIKSGDYGTINYKALNSKKFAKINAYLDPLKSINKEITPIAIYQDQKNVNDIYDELIKTQVMKYRLMNVKANGYHNMDYKYEDELFQEVTIAHVKKILFHLGDGTLRTKEYSVLIFILHQVVQNLETTEDKYHQVTKWIIKNRGFDEIFNSILYYVNSRRDWALIENGIFEIMVIVRMLINLSNVAAELGNPIFFNINKINKYSIINEKVLQHLSSDLVSGEHSKSKEKVLILLEEIVKEISRTQFSSEVLLRIIINRWNEQQLKDDNEVNIFKINFYLKSIIKLMLTILTSPDVINPDNSFVGLETQLSLLLNSDEPIIRKESMLIYSILFKISQKSENGIQLQHFGKLTDSQQNFIIYYCEYL